MAFIDGISRFGEALQNNPDVRRAGYAAMGYDPMKADAAVAPLQANRAAQEAQGAITQILQASGGKITPQVLMQINAIDPGTAQFIQKMYEQKKAQSTVGKINADLSAGLIDPETGQAALRKATTTNPQYMMSPDGEVIAVHPETGQVMNLGMDGMPQPPSAQPSAPSGAMGGLITPPPSGLSPKGRAAWTDKQVTAASETLEGLKSTASKLPQLVDTMNQLSKLADSATYTMAGQGLDWVAGQAGITTEGKLARTNYTSMVDNQILPILRDTFGAAFTEKEGNTLRKTLGDPDKTPLEKQAVLSSFIRQKGNDIAALGSKTGIDVSPILQAMDKLRIGKQVIEPAATGGWSAKEIK